MATQEDFIGVYENAFSKEYCDAIIQYHTAMSEAGFSMSRREWESANNTQKDDYIVFAHHEEQVSLAVTKDLMSQFNNVFWGGPYKHYSEKFGHIQNLSTHSSYCGKIQKTKVGGGYHSWHCEVNSRHDCHVLLAWMLYLNDVEEGGETEFLYQHRRIKPKAGTLLLWPAGFTHTHRGNPPLSNEKYVITGWVEF